MKEKSHRQSPMTLFQKKLVEHHRLKGKGLAFALSVLFYLAFTFYVLALFQIEQVSNMTIVSVLFFKVILFFILHKRWKRFLLLIYSIVISLLFLLTYKQINAGFLLSLNKMFDTFGRQTGLLLEPFSVSSEIATYSLSLNLFWFIVLHVISLLSIYIVVFKKRLFLIIFMVAILMLSLFTQLQATIVSEIVLLFTFIILIIYTTLSNKGGIRLGSYYRVYTLSILFVTIAITLLFVGINILTPIKNYEKAQLGQTLEQDIKTYLDSVRFEKEVTNTFTKGDLNELKGLKLFDVPALEIMMDDPSSMYLKGFVGATYEQNKWTELDEETTYKASQLIRSLSASELNIFTQLHTLAESTGEEIDTTKVTVNNINESSKYMYYPYELKTDPSQLPEVRANGDYEISGRGIFGERTFKYDITSNLVVTYPNLANKLYENEDDEALQQYLLLESHYNEFVYDQYVDIPDYIELLIENHFELDPYGVSGNRLSYEVAINEVKDFLYRKIKYNEEPPVLTEGMDFVVHFLEGSKEGFSSHYATAATLMFRYLGIPARYVEGFLVTPEDIKSVEPYEKLVITGENAHAWPEIYIDRIGWIPIEVTPPYYDQMLAVDLSNYPEGHREENIYETETMQAAEENSIQEVVDEDEQTRNDLKQEEEIFPFFTLIIYVAIVLLLLFLFIYVMKKRIEVYKRKNKCKQTDRNEAVVAMFSYIAMLIEYDGIQLTYGPMRNKINNLSQTYSDEYSEQFQIVLQINEKALYSNETISEAEFIKVNELLEKTLEYVKKSRNLWHRFKMKYIHNLY